MSSDMQTLLTCEVFVKEVKKRETATYFRLQKYLRDPYRGLRLFRVQCALRYLRSVYPAIGVTDDEAGMAITRAEGGERRARDRLAAREAVLLSDVGTKYAAGSSLRGFMAANFAPTHCRSWRRDESTIEVCMLRAA
jgi:hypothetical protein